MSIKKAILINLQGVVQGVGFRPFVYRLAEEINIKGWVQNTNQGLKIHAEGEHLKDFYDRLMKEGPPLALVTETNFMEVPVKNYSSFSIVQNSNHEQAEVLISPDIATCPKCREELRDPLDRRFNYPFINCTNCGPRYSIVRKVPYDRNQTTMNSFSMCPECKAECKNPLDRRFHAQPVACEKCGPTVQLKDRSGNHLPGLGIEELASGAILAIKGLGGFHLVCDARNPKTIERLRKCKKRGEKPLALMAKSLEKIKEQLKVSREEENILTSFACPIVILERLNKVHCPLPLEIAPYINTIGVMLPYTPLHTLLFDGPYDFLVMTSANLSGRPLIYQDEVALTELKNIADYFLIHNREIYHPCDDSVVQVIGGKAVFHRRARGYVPLPQHTMEEIGTPLLGVGGELKNCFCLTAGNKAFVSQYIGDMQRFDNFLRFKQEISSLQEVAHIVPQVVAHDAHPNYQTTRYALESTLLTVKVQHHHAHLVSVLGEHGITETMLGVICDGMGWGTDHKIWGFEFISGNAKECKRLAHLEYLPLPGGDVSLEHPLRISYAYAKDLLSKEALAHSESLWNRLTPKERKTLDWQLDKKVQIFETSSAGRLFDAISALIDVCQKVTYEGQAAIELEGAATKWDNAGIVEEADDTVYPIHLQDKEGLITLKVDDLFAEIVQDILLGVEKNLIAYRFHRSLAQAIVETIIKIQGSRSSVVLTGGVFQNKLLTEMVIEKCKVHQIQVLRSKSLPPGDGGISYGQVLIANEVLKDVSCRTS